MNLDIRRLGAEVESVLKQTDACVVNVHARTRTWGGDDARGVANTHAGTRTLVQVDPDDAARSAITCHGSGKDT